MFEFMTVRELYEICRADNAVETDNVEYVELEGWVRTNRDSGKLGFIALMMVLILEIVRLFI